MLTISKTRIIIVTVVTLLCLALTYPTARYYRFLTQPVPPQNGVRPEPKSPMPPADETVLMEAWKKENPQVVAWMASNQSYLDWEKREETLRADAIPLGLDLIGGADVTLVVDKEKLLQNESSSIITSVQEQLNLAKVSQPIMDATADGFTVKLKDAQKDKADAQKIVDTLSKYVGKILSAPSADQLASGQSVNIRLNPTYINKTVTDSLEGVRKGISDRVDQLGVTQPRISVQGTDSIRVQVPGVKDPDRLINNVIQPAKLEFRLVSDRSGDTSIFGPDGKVKPGAVVPPGTEIVAKKIVRKDPKTGKIGEPEVGYMLLSTKAPVTGKDLRVATVRNDLNDIENPVKVELEFKDSGTKTFGDLTRNNIGKNLAIVLDGVVRSYPRLNVPILDGRCEITGGFSQDEATDLAQVLKAGALPAPLKIQDRKTVGATLGFDSIKAGIHALIIGSIIITILMVGYYGTAGVISVFALFLHILIILALMALSRATLTLSGIGGVLLTVGMAVDANILIYERMREELRAGKPLKQALGLGFHRAFSVILDSNVTTLLSALVLLQFTEGSVLGFALTMAFGIVANLFTGLTVTYTLCGLWFNWRGDLSLGKVAILTNPKIKFVEMRWLSWGGSSLLGLLAIVATLATGHYKLGVDFAGGYRAEVQFDKKVLTKDIQEADLRAALDKVPYFKQANITRVTDPRLPDYFITDVQSIPTADIPKLITKEMLPTGRAMDSISQLDATQIVFNNALSQSFPNGSYKMMASTGFGAQTSQGFIALAIWVTILSSLAIMAYLWFRFEMVFGVGAVVALLHDMVIVFFLACLWGVQVNLEVVAAMMVLMGFSVNDTIVIFDRIRENTRVMPNKSFGEICDLAMNQCLSRTILTSGTVFAAALCLFLIGGEGLNAFAKIYVIGTIIGTYSSDFIAAPIVYQWNKYKGDRVRQMLSAQKKKKEVAKPIRQSV